MKEVLLKRFACFGVGEGPEGDVRNDDLRCATIELDDSGLELGFNDAEDSRLDFSARALIL